MYDAPAGFIEASSLTEHSVSMHVGPPAVATCACNGRPLHRLQKAGDIDIVPVGFRGVWEAAGLASMLLVNISPSLVRTAANALGLSVDRLSIEPQLQLKDPQLEHILWALKVELETDEPLGRLYADSLGLALTAQLLRRYASISPARRVNRLPKRQLVRVTEYIHEHLALNLSLCELATIAELSTSHFKVLFKRAVGMPVHQYVVKCRVEHATALLLSGRVAPSEAAAQAGFADQSHMARCMRRVAGITPRMVSKNF